MVWCANKRWIVIVLRVLIIPIAVYALMILYWSFDSIPNWFAGRIDYALTRHWPVILLNMILLIILVPVWFGIKLVALILGVISGAYIILSISMNYWPYVHVPYGAVLLLISFLSYCFGNSRPNQLVERMRNRRASHQ